MDGGGQTGGAEVVSPADLQPLQRCLSLLAELAEQRRAQRLAAGAVELESAELRFRTDAQGRPLAVAVKQEVPMMRVVAELMILANAAVGQRLVAAFPRAALLRRHPPPRKDAFGEVRMQRVCGQFAVPACCVCVCCGTEAEPEASCPLPPHLPPHLPPQVAALCEALGRPLDLPAHELARGDGNPVAAKLRDHELWMDGAAQAAVIYDRALLRQGDVVRGPAVITEMDSTTLIETRHIGTVDAFGNILITPA